MMPSDSQIGRSQRLRFSWLWIAMAACVAGDLAAEPNYVGTSKCIDCHKAQYASYLQTTHSRSVARPGERNESETASFLHALSGHKYEVETRDEKLIHREIMNDADGKPLKKTEFPIAYTIGSGAHGLSYVYETEGFYLQSPISWYQTTKKWEMSPGYDVPFSPGFRRSVSNSCFFCHVGSIDREDDNPHQFTIREQVIGCERCHGPGEHHVDRFTQDPKASLKGDSIVHPGKLSRELSEAICQQCHLQAAGKAVAAGKDEWDYRPGQPLVNTRIDYQYRLGDDTMRIVGHVEQLHMSKCYTQTESLTCVTCHDPHHVASKGNLVNHYRSICLNCHENESCGKPLVDRNRLTGNDCSVCHMPKEDTDVTHAAFRHHRIGIHNKAEAESRDVIVGLTAVLPTDSLSETARRRAEAIAKFQVSQAEPNNRAFQQYGFDAARELIQIHNRGESDVDATAILALLASTQRQPAIALKLSKEILQKETKPTRSRIEALRQHGIIAFENRDYDVALKSLNELTRYQRNAYDWFYLGLAEQAKGRSRAAFNAFQKAVDIDPTMVDAYRLLAQQCDKLGLAGQAGDFLQDARRHEALLRKLMEKARAQ